MTGNLFTRGCVTIDRKSDAGSYVDALAWAALFNRSAPVGSQGRDDGPTPLPSPMISPFHSTAVSQPEPHDHVA